MRDLVAVTLRAGSIATCRRQLAVARTMTVDAGDPGMRARPPCADQARITFRVTAQALGLRKRAGRR